MRRFLRSFIGFVVGTAGALALMAIFHLSLWGRETEPAFRVETAPVNRDARLGASFAPVVKKAAPSVVNIYSTHIVRLRAMRNPFFNDPFFRQFFGGQLPEDDREYTRREHALGSGVIVSPDGYILTANHVVDGADEIKVSLGENKKEFDAKIIGTDPPTDVAVLKIDAKNLPAITLADSAQLEIGDVVLAIGNPYGLSQTVTMGIVSALGRNNLPGFNLYQDFIQTDAAINPGNSGGALVDIEGRLVGINTAIVPNSNGGNQGIGFAVPINLARHVMERLISGGKVNRGYLGIYLQDITPGLAKAFNLPDQSGALVRDLMAGGPAQKAGIKAGDVIVNFNGKDVSDVAGLMLAISECSPGTSATVKLLRQGQTKTVSVDLAESSTRMSAVEPERSSGTGSSMADLLAGVTVHDLDDYLRQQLGVENLQGALVEDVDPDSNAAEAGLQRGDVILEINQQAVRNAADAVKLGRQAKGDQILLKVWRRNGDLAGTQFLSVDNKKKK